MGWLAADRDGAEVYGEWRWFKSEAAANEARALSTHKATEEVGK